MALSPLTNNDTLSRNAGVLSPISSPAPQMKQHSAGNLTGELRKVKDLVADFHNLMMKWDSLNNQGMEIVLQIANIKIEKVINVLEKEGTCETTLPNELNPLCDLLSDIVKALAKVEAKMESKAAVAESLLSLQRFQKVKPDSPVLFMTMTLEDIASTTREIHLDYLHELTLKTELCKHLAHVDSRDTVMFFSSCWMHQPYIRAQNHDLLQSLLKETGHVK